MAVYLYRIAQEAVTNAIRHGEPQNILMELNRLSDRELEVFRLIGTGYGTREMAEKLHLSVKTIETYRRNQERVSDEARSATICHLGNNMPPGQHRL